MAQAAIQETFSDMVEIPAAPAVADIDGFQVFGFDSVANAAHWVLTAPDRPNIGVAMNAEKVISARAQGGVLDPIKPHAFFYPDGMPVVWTMAQKGVASERIPGVELWDELMRQAGDRPVYILGAQPDVNAETVEKLKTEYGLTNVRGQHGYFDDEDAVIAEIAAFQPAIVSVALGSPKQEKFMLKALEHAPNTYFMGVGGTYNVFTGREPRAPQWMAKRGFEWLFRLYRTPARWRRNLTYFVYMYRHWARKL